MKYPMQIISNKFLFWLGRDLLSSHESNLFLAPTAKWQSVEKMKEKTKKKTKKRNFLKLKFILSQEPTHETKVRHEIYFVSYKNGLCFFVAKSISIYRQLAACCIIRTIKKFLCNLSCHRPYII